ncbi:antitoxin of toxin-antitoxin stability system [Paremcibacter congregatus]|uniref:antitoxin of toxin-antitoxin stability system n=1 Tax=Paremcibacter congregatus TaxID=2043170 RepID=UPI0030EDC8D8|tara:strand:- start:795 stop:1433 length:639 start_codon:yes stop_codon:yes gene_type:complete
MSTIIKTEVFIFDELSNVAKECARDWYREAMLDYDWWSFVYDDFAVICKILGIKLKTRSVKLVGGGKRQEPCIQFSGFCSQGDGASFEVDLYAYARKNTPQIKAHAPKDIELHDIAACLAAIQRRNFYQLYARVDHRGRYVHENMMQVDVRRDDAEMTTDAEDIITEAMRDLSRWLYGRLMAEYEYLLSDGQVEESITANGLTFTADGRRFG